MDAGIIVTYIDYIKSTNNIETNEKFNGNQNSIYFNKMNMFVSIIIGAYAADISYDYNTELNMPEGMKILYAIMAFIFGIFYLIWYFLVTPEKLKN